MAGARSSGKGFAFLKLVVQLLGVLEVSAFARGFRRSQKHYGGRDGGQGGDLRGL